MESVKIGPRVYWYKPICSELKNRSTQSLLDDLEDQISEDKELISGHYSYVYISELALELAKRLETAQNKLNCIQEILKPTPQYPRPLSEAEKQELNLLPEEDLPPLREGEIDF